VGVAAGNWLYWYQTDCQVEVGVEDGRLFVATGVQDIGTGIRSVLARTVADAFDLEPARVLVRIGDSRLVRGPASGGSATTATLVPATLEAVARLRQRLFEHVRTANGLRGARAEKTGVSHAGGHIRWAEAIASLPRLIALADRPEDVPSASRAGPRWAGTGLAGRVIDRLARRLLKIGTGRGYTGAVHMSEVEADTLLGKTRVLRVAAGIAAGRIAAPELARSQCYGGVIQGIGYALYERADPRPRNDA
jgi:xanthine dehydrogenase YagR molybdenum-binding subunit